MSTDLERQLARFAEALDREAPAISFDDIVGRGPVAVEVDVLESPEPDRTATINGVPWTGGASSRDEIGERDVLIELAPAVAARRPAWRRVAAKVALGVAAAAVVIVTVTAIERDGDDRDPVVDLPSLTTTFVSPKHGFSIKLPEEADVTPATQLWAFSGRDDDGYDLVELGSGAVFRGASADLGHRSIGLSIDERADKYLLNDYVLPGACGVPRSQQAEITIDGRSGRVAECSNRIEATVVVKSQVQELGPFTAGRVYLFTLSHDRSDARAVFDAFVATIDLTAGKGRAGLAVGGRVRIAGTGLYSGEIAVIEKLVTGVIPQAVVRTEAGKTRQVRTIDLEPVAANATNVAPAAAAAPAPVAPAAAAPAPVAPAPAASAPVVLAPPAASADPGPPEA